ncbi:hypothetical protein WKK05_36390 (plasmid) [Nostoc sp. UHCC 0302]|uniref:hypothetical protein n=1 Tax=Nostoc sp. UHCC 0302 TaxID=3134896 RepID=UPI00311CA141
MLSKQLHSLIKPARIFATNAIGLTLSVSLVLNSSTSQAGKNSAGSVLAELQGRWQVSHMNSLVPVNPSSGAIGDANGMIAEYEIKPDGSLIHTFFLQQAQYGCTRRLKTLKTGRTVVKGSSVTFIYEAGTTSSEDSCNRQYNYTKKLAPSQETFNFTLQQEGEKTKFCFENESLKDCAVKLN